MDTRQMQINSMLQTVTNITEKYNNFYEVLWYDPKVNRTLCLSISLPPQFPMVAPVYKVTPPVYHPWIDSSGMVVGHKKLGTGWNQHVSLANLTNEIIKELKSGKITAAPGASPQLSYPGLGMSNSLPRMTASATGSYYYSNQQIPPRNPNNVVAPNPYFQSLGHTNSMPASTVYSQSNNDNMNDISLADLDSMSLDELKELLNNDNKRKEYINKKDKVKEMKQVVEELSTSNKDLAEKILSFKENFENLKAELREHQNILKGEKAQFETLMAEQNKYVSNYSPEKLYSTLQQSSYEADRESEEIANDFLMGTLSADEFLKKYRTARKLHHLRSEKLELFSSNQDTMFIKK